MRAYLPEGGECQVLAVNPEAIDRSGWLLLAFAIAVVECCVLPYKHHARHYPGSVSTAASRNDGR